MKPATGAENPKSLTFSVVIPTFNRPDSLAATLESLVNQRFPKNRFEVIVVDDGSPLPSQSVVAPFQEKIEVKACRQQRAGVAAARNAGSAIAGAKNIAFIDDDCRADPEWLSELDKTFASAPPRSLLGGSTINGAPDNVFAEVGELILAVIRDFYRPGPGGIYFFRAANLAVSGDEFRSAGGFNPEFRTAEDREFCDRWLHQGGNLLYVSKARVAHINRLTFAGFCRQHFNYGRGAFRFHRIRKARGSGRFRTEFFFFYLRVLRAAFTPSRSFVLAKVLLLITWQIVNLAGFFFEMLFHSRSNDERKNR